MHYRSNTARLKLAVADRFEKSIGLSDDWLNWRRGSPQDEPLPERISLIAPGGNRNFDRLADAGKFAVFEFTQLFQVSA